ncbi:SLC13 family permease [Haladaptatus pallidirubidus]|uniref:SLC13 family permease n=1 Tax=Haladaptatus pallidirubidus TaxID=1008152 RepID=UPI0035EA2CEC
MSDLVENDTSGKQRDTLVMSGGVALSIVPILWSVLVPPPHGFTPEMQSVLAVFAFSLVLWLSKAVPYVISATISVVLLFALGGVDTFQDATIGFASSLVFFLLLLLLLGQAISKVDLDAWFASRLLSAGGHSHRPIRALSGYMLALSFVMPSAVARTVTFIPVVRQMTEAYGLGHDSDFERTSFLVLGHINPIASMTLMTGGGMAIITSELVQSEIQPITWVEWATLMIPPVVVLYVLSAFTAERFYDARSEVEDATPDDTARLNSPTIWRSLPISNLVTINSLSVRLWSALSCYGSLDHSSGFLRSFPLPLPSECSHSRISASSRRTTSRR